MVNNFTEFWEEKETITKVIQQVQSDVETITGQVGKELA